MISIVQYPAPTLLKPVERFKCNRDIEQCFKDVDKAEEFIKANPHCLGLAANQVSTENIWSWFLMKQSRSGEIRFFTNPRIIGRIGTQKSKEGCFSHPNENYIVKRAKQVTLEWGVEIPEREVFTGIDAICIQHEVDHLLGRTIQVTGKKVS